MFFERAPEPLKSPKGEFLQVGLVCREGIEEGGPAGALHAPGAAPGAPTVSRSPGNQLPWLC